MGIKHSDGGGMDYEAEVDHTSTLDIVFPKFIYLHMQVYDSTYLILKQTSKRHHPQWEHIQTHGIH